MLPGVTWCQCRRENNKQAVQRFCGPPANIRVLYFIKPQCEALHLRPSASHKGNTPRGNNLFFKNELFPLGVFPLREALRLNKIRYSNSGRGATKPLYRLLVILLAALVGSSDPTMLALRDRYQWFLAIFSCQALLKVYNIYFSFTGKAEIKIMICWPLSLVCSICYLLRDAFSYGGNGPPFPPFY